MMWRWWIILAVIVIPITGCSERPNFPIPLPISDHYDYPLTMN